MIKIKIKHYLTKTKTLALRESKYGNKSYKDKLEEFKGDKKVRPVSKNIISMPTIKQKKNYVIE